MTQSVAIELPEFNKVISFRALGPNRMSTSVLAVGLCISIYSTASAAGPRDAQPGFVDLVTEAVRADGSAQSKGKYPLTFDWSGLNKTPIHHSGEISSYPW